MGKGQIGRTSNTYDDPTMPEAIELNATTFTVIFAENAKRLGYTVSNLGQQDIIIREKAFGDDNERGFALWGKTTYISPTDRIAKGEISMMSRNGTPSVLVTEIV